jgi:hypothetical protein
MKTPMTLMMNSSSKTDVYFAVGITFYICNYMLLNLLQFVELQAVGTASGGQTWLRGRQLPHVATMRN